MNKIKAAVQKIFQVRRKKLISEILETFSPKKTEKLQMFASDFIHKSYETKDCPLHEAGSRFLGRVLDANEVGYSMFGERWLSYPYSRALWEADLIDAERANFSPKKLIREIDVLSEGEERPYWKY
jgi:hypothetical protein